MASENVFTIFLPASVTALLQPMDQGIRRDFMRNFVTPRGRLQALAPRCSVHDAVLDVACAWDAPPSLGFSRQKHWSGLPFPSPMHESEKGKGSHSVLSDS